MHLFSRMRQQIIKKMLETKTTSRSSLCATLGNNHLIAQFIAKSLWPEFFVLNNHGFFIFSYLCIKSLLQALIASVVAFCAKNTTKLLCLQSLMHV